MKLLTCSENIKIPIPIGMNSIPVTKNVGRTVLAVRIGCHAGNFCCLNALSERLKHTNTITKNYNIFCERSIQEPGTFSRHLLRTRT